jgi:molybdopterin-guanine dinucleotide biosynthesis protein A
VRTGIVLAGGRSARFGADKLTESIDGESLLERAIAAAAAVSDEVLVAGRAVTGHPSEGGSGFASVRGVPDIEPFGGPLVGLIGALAQARAPMAIVVGADMPGLVPNVLRSMLDRLDGDGSVDAVTLERPDAEPNAPLAVLPIAIRTAAARAAAQAAVSEGRRSLRSLLDHLGWIELPVEVWLPLDPGARTLLDVDTQADIERVRAGKER